MLISVMLIKKKHVLVNSKRSSMYEMNGRKIVLKQQFMSKK